MLSAAEVCDRLSLDCSHPDRLSIVPRPSFEGVLARGGTSIDLRLGRWFRSFKQSRNSQAQLWKETEPSGDAAKGSNSALATNEHFVRFGKNFVLHPGRFVLGVTIEWLSLPRSLSGYVTGKSSLGRHGLVIETAAGLHPGFSGCLTLELANVGEIPLAISPGMEICQIFLHKVDAAPGSSGQFSGQRKPGVGLPSSDPVFNQLRRGG